MSKADDDAAKWLEAYQLFQAKRLIWAKEVGGPHYINEHGDVVFQRLQEKLDEKAKEVVFGIKPTPNK